MTLSDVQSKGGLGQDRTRSHCGSVEHLGGSHEAYIPLLRAATTPCLCLCFTLSLSASPTATLWGSLSLLLTPLHFSSLHGVLSSHPAPRCSESGPWLCLALSACSTSHTTSSAPSSSSACVLPCAPHLLYPGPLSCVLQSSHIWGTGPSPLLTFMTPSSCPAWEPPRLQHGPGLQDHQQQLAGMKFEQQTLPRLFITVYDSSFPVPGLVLSDSKHRARGCLPIL